MSIHYLCKPRPTVFAAGRRATVLSLDPFLKGQVNGPEFFEENSGLEGLAGLKDNFELNNLINKTIQAGFD